MVQCVEKQPEIETTFGLLTEALNATSDYVFLVRFDFPNFIYVNETASKKLEYSAEELLGGMSVFDIDADWPTIELWRKHTCDLRILGSLRFETRHRTKSGYCYPVEVTATFSQHSGQDVVLGIVRDVSERKACEAAVVYREQELRALAESSPGVMGSLVMKHGRMRVPYASQNILDIFGLFPNDIADDIRPLQQLIYAGDAKKLYVTLIQSAKNLSEWCEQFRIIHPAKGLRWLEGRAKPQSDAKSGVIWYGHIYDITDRKFTEDRLRLSLELNEGIIAAIPDMLFKIDQNGTYIDVWSKNAALLISQREELIGKKFQDVLPQNVVDIAYQSMKEADDYGYSVGHQYALDLPDGKRWFELYVTKKKTSGSYIVLARDVTEKKSSERMLSTLVEALNISSESIFLIELDTGNFVYVNDTACHTLGYSREALTGGMGVVDIDPNMSIDDWRAHVLDIRQFGHTSIESHHTSKDGHTYPIEALSHYFAYEGDEYSLAVTRDISERLRAQAEIAQASNFANSILNTLPDLLFEVDRDGVYLNIWASDATLLAKRKEQLLGRRIVDVFDAENAHVCMQALCEAEAEGRSVGQKIYIDFPEGRKWFELSVSQHLPYEHRFLILSRELLTL